MAATQELIKRYEEGAELLAEALHGLPADALDRVPAPGKWTIRQIAVHLADAEVVIAARIRAVAGEPGSKIAAFDQEHWAKNMVYEKLPVEPALALMRAIRQSTAALLRALPAEAWSRTGIHSERGEQSLTELVQRGIEHGESHARQIRDHRARFAAVA